MSRREVLQAGMVTAAAPGFFVAQSHAENTVSAYAKVFPLLDAYVEQYMRDMNTPGMTLVLTAREGIQRVVTYGFGDIERRLPIRPEELFHIGSISKSFTALCLLQLHDEGRLDLHRPIVEYLPWFRIDSAFAPVTAHHLLTHSSGLPAYTEVFPSDPLQKHRAAHAPGEHYHYNNMAFLVLGHLAWSLDGREMPELLRKRIFEPLGMTQSEPVITLDTRDRMVKSYAAFQRDRPLSRHGRLCEAPAIIYTGAAGSIASTPRDMGLYLQMLANHGVGPKQRLLSERSFELFASSYIAAKKFAPGSTYGYGIAIEHVEGHKVLHHLGGMPSFSSAMRVDIDAGVGAFGSINALQGAYPTPVVEFATRLMRAQREGKALPRVPSPVAPPTHIDNAADYAGSFKSGNGRELQFVAQGQSLILLHAGSQVRLEKSATPDRFIVPHKDFSRFMLVFGRKQPGEPNSAIVEVIWGGDWYVNSAYQGPLEFNHPREWASYVGHYIGSMTDSSLRIVLRQGRLWLAGVTPLEPVGELFYLREEAHSPEWVRFGEVVNGRCMRLKLSGSDCWRAIDE
ncbi:serine hydrolase domain-containing protein [Steroidobacter sp.]|uniref:serine hydrolase domain-containing protein n=1 Tax=Steroidobacter sp. TaxID=1978227 RepID=UPI001A402683|nr:serine hydrolase domain-containing protein [Steroidobacter sp.]MBL8268825.1 beta-lactamase family protein [Steroidobacter sp.]